MESILGFFASIFGGLLRNQRSSLSDQQLGDVGFIMDEDYYKRDIIIAGKKISVSPYLEERIQAVRDVGHLAWLGGPAAAKFAANHLMEFVSLLENELAPIKLKEQVLYAVAEMCLCTEDNREKARTVGMLVLLCDLLDSPEADLRRGATGCLISLVNENYENYRTVLAVPKIKEKLLMILQDDWRKWQRNEAARLILMLGLNRLEDPVAPVSITENSE